MREALNRPCQCDCLLRSHQHAALLCLQPPAFTPAEATLSMRAAGKERGRGAEVGGAGDILRKARNGSAHDYARCDRTTRCGCAKPRTSLQEGWTERGQQHYDTSRSTFR
eukprot:1229595-Pleurochrysis_carterae.AAC.1